MVKLVQRHSRLDGSFLLQQDEMFTAPNIGVQDTRVRIYTYKQDRSSQDSPLSAAWLKGVG